MSETIIINGAALRAAAAIVQSAQPGPMRNYLLDDGDLIATDGFFILRAVGATNYDGRAVLGGEPKLSLAARKTYQQGRLSPEGILTDHQGKLHQVTLNPDGLYPDWRRILAPELLTGAELTPEPMGDERLDLPLLQAAKFVGHLPTREGATVGPARRVKGPYSAVWVWGHEHDGVSYQLMTLPIRLS